MRQFASHNGLSVKAYAGTTGVLLAMNLEPQLRQGLLGFALRRIDGRSGKREWLTGMLPFPHMQLRPGSLISTKVAPIQKFRWSDYRVYPDTQYTYLVHPVYGNPQHPDVQPGVEITIKTASLLQGEHRVVFNRAAAASQAFSRKFPEVDAAIATARRAKQAPPPLPPEALAWLSRGVLEQIVHLIEQAADPTWAIDIAIYEYELPEIVHAIEAAYARGVNLRLVYHAKPGDPQTVENEHHLAGLPDAVKRGRLTHNICHHKFIVLSRLESGKLNPQAVLCGSTNFTHNGVYRQANVVHVVENPAIAQPYLHLFEELFRGETQTATRRYINQTNSLDLNQPTLVGFSPRSGGADLQTFVDLVNQAKRDVLFCTAFDLYDPLEGAFLGKPNDPILRYGIQNSRSQITGFHADRTAAFVATAMLSTGLEGFLKESTKGQRGNILIHTKLIVIDFTSDAPIVITGSHNFSNNASRNNDENFLILQGNSDVADCYGCELMRLYDHYRFRYRVRGSADNSEDANPTETALPRSPALTPDDSWTETYFTPNSLKMRDRLWFAGQDL